MTKATCYWASARKFFGHYAWKIYEQLKININVYGRKTQQRNGKFTRSRVEIEVNATITIYVSDLSASVATNY